MPIRRLLLPALLLGLLAAAPPPAEARPKHPPVVVLMFDEFEFSSLFDSHEHFDPVRFPNFAALARSATVYRRFTAEGDITGPASGSLLASVPYRLGADRGGIYANYPHNLFTIFRARGYHMTVREAATNLCPGCAGDHAPEDAHDVLHNLHGRAQQFKAWLKLLHGGGGRFFFEHLLLPHGPIVYSPIGHVYRGDGELIPGLNSAPSFADPWLVRQQQQRYLMQVEFVDSLVGRLVKRLKATGLWGRAVIVLTADNGEGWGHLGSDPHRIDRRTLAEIVQTPLVIRTPGQRRGRYTDKRVRSVDLVPTLGRLAHVPVGKVAGRPFVGRGANRIPRGPIRAYDDDGHRYTFTPEGLAKELRAAILQQVRVFGQHTRDLFRIGPSPGLLGQAVGALEPAEAPRYRASVHPASELRHVSFHRQVVPIQIVGTLKGPGVHRGMPFALALNGRIAATGRTSRLRGSKTIWLSAMVPESALKPGANQAGWFLLRGGRLARVTTR